MGEDYLLSNRESEAISSIKGTSGISFKKSIKYIRKFLRRYTHSSISNNDPISIDEYIYDIRRVFKSILYNIKESYGKKGGIYIPEISIFFYESESVGKISKIYKKIFWIDIRLLEISGRMQQEKTLRHPSQVMNEGERSLYGVIWISDLADFEGTLDLKKSIFDFMSHMITKIFQSASM